MHPSAAFLLSPEGMPVFIQPLLTPFNMSYLRGKLVSSSEVKCTALPRSRIFSLPGHYEKVLQKADAAGMLEWSAVQNEEAVFSKLADRITMSSFAVTKDVHRDRFISWPRVQNLLLPEPPHVNLPSPAVFSLLRMAPKGQVSGFYLDIENMFHNISLPPHLVRFFPLTKVRFGNLPGSIQAKLRKDLGQQLQQSAFVRPYQSTLPMGFKWAAYIGHTLAESCIEKAVSEFKEVARTIPNFKLGSIIVASQKSEINRINEGDAAFFHIIDDVNFFAIEWPAIAVVILHALVIENFRKQHLHVKESKSLPLGRVETDVLPFIGWEWNLKTGIIEAQKSRLSNAISEACNILGKERINIEEFEQAVGRLIWQSLGHRPLLATLSTVFKLSHGRFSSIEPCDLYRAARKELAICATLSPLVRINVYRSYWTTVVCVDASEEAGAVTYATAEVKELERLLSFWYRFLGNRSDLRKLKYKAHVATFVKRKAWKTAFVHR